MARIKSVTFAKPLKSSSFCIIVNLKLDFCSIHYYIIICAYAFSSFSFVYKGKMGQYTREYGRLP